MASEEKKSGLTEEVLERYEEQGRTVGFAISDVPVSLYREFMYDIHHYGDKYILKLQDLMRKAETYDFLVRSGLVPQSLPVEQEEYFEDDEEDSEGVQTFGGVAKKRN